jgi:hypothetical protein
MLIFLQLFFVSFEIFDHQIFSGELVVIGKMIDDLVISQADSYISHFQPDFGLKRLRTVQTVAQ